MSTSSKKKTQKKNDTIGNDDNNTAKVNTKTYANLKETLNFFSKTNKEKRKNKRVRDAYASSGLKSGKKDSFGKDKVVESGTDVLNAIAMRKKSIVDKKPKRRGTPK